jgi:hypothetical protein
MNLPMLLQHTTKHQWVTLAIVALFALLPIAGIGQQQGAEAAQVKEQSARASWTKCSRTTCTDTLIIGTIKGKSKTLTFDEVTYRKTTGNVISSREAFARNVNFKQDGLNSASLNATIAVKKCNSQDVCKNAGRVQVKARWTGKGGETVDPEDGTRSRRAKVTGTVAGKKLGQVNFATLTVLPK